MTSCVKRLRECELVQGLPVFVSEKPVSKRILLMVILIVWLCGGLDLVATVVPTRMNSHIDYPKF